MASAESQGKTIALVMFVLLSLTMSVTAYYFFSQVDRLEQEKKAIQGQLTEERTKNVDLREAKLIPTLRLLNGSVVAENIDVVYQEMFDLLNKPVVDPKTLGNKPKYESFKDAMQYLQSIVVNANQELDTLRQQKAEVENNLRLVEAKYNKVVDEQKAVANKAMEDLRSEQDNFKVVIDDKDSRFEAMQQDYNLKRDELEGTKRVLNKQISDLGDQVRDLNFKIADLQEEQRKSELIRFQAADGMVVELDGTSYAYINLGRADGAERGLTFSVHGKDAGGNPYALPKAKIEIAQILGDRRAKALVTERNGNEPILPGDVLYNPVWDPGHKPGVAFVGNIYIDDDDIPDNEQFKKLVEDYGGKVDAWFDPVRNKVIGEITINTKWLVEGEVPELRSASAEIDEVRAQRDRAMVAGAVQLRQQAKSNGVPRLNARNFLTYMGYKAPRRIVRAGEEDLTQFDRRPAIIENAPASSTQNR